ncbi:hypothetical protein BPIT_23300 [Candidatus Brocadia pituitae]|nr:hypothetical protein BPIT_23300 [Candidatus Brocadia pituitae]
MGIPKAMLDGDTILVSLVNGCQKLPLITLKRSRQVVYPSKDGHLKNTDHFQREPIRKTPYLTGD